MKVRKMFHTLCDLITNFRIDNLLNISVFNSVSLMAEKQLSITFLTLMFWEINLNASSPISIDRGT